MNDERWKKKEFIKACWAPSLSLFLSIRYGARRLTNRPLTCKIKRWINRPVHEQHHQPMQYLSPRRTTSCWRRKIRGLKYPLPYRTVPSWAELKGRYSSKSGGSKRGHVHINKPKSLDYFVFFSFALHPTCCRAESSNDKLTYIKLLHSWLSE